jgi:hypothetical protein
MNLKRSMAFGCGPVFGTGRLLTSPAWQTKAGSVAYQTQDSGQSMVPPGWYDNDPAMSQWYTPPYFSNENPS